jgi:Zn-dependent protease with chaperone function/type II secretory pathway pseudopilin PulG
MDLVYKNEKTLFRIAAVLSAVFWLALTVGTFGIFLVYLLLGYLFFLFAHSAFISHIKGSGVKISEEQYPDLYEKLTRGCSKVGLNDIPEAYLLRTDFFNALATNFLGRHFVVLFTDVVDALESQPGAIDFYIGHELGHIHRKHLTWSTFIMPASVLPLLGSALRRAEEYTCDRYGVACCESADDIQAAIAAIAAGDTRWKSINIDSYLNQISDTNGFWMSFNELTSDYPWLTKRMATSIALSKGDDIKHPRRHGFAWLLSLFIPRFGSGGIGSLLVTVAIIGIFASVALPAYQDYVERARFASAYSSAQEVKNKVTEYTVTNNEWPQSLQSLGYTNDEINDTASNTQIGIYNNGIVGVKVGIDDSGKEKYIVLKPEVINSEIKWQCYGENVLVKNLPKSCQ